MGPPTDVATANVLCSLGPHDARRALADVLELAPDLVGLQEWYPSRIRLLLERGQVGLVPHVGARLPAQGGGPTHGRPQYLWNAPLLGGCVVGARADRFDLLSCRTRFLSSPGRADRGEGHLGLEPARAATLAVYRDRRLEHTVCLINFHLVSGVQSGSAYRTDRPLLAARHRHEAQAVGRLVREQLERGHVVHATGDSNFDGLRISGLTSAWEGRRAEQGTLGPRRKVDDVHGPGPAEAVTTVRTASDHRAVVVRRRQAAPPVG